MRKRKPKVDAIHLNRTFRKCGVCKEKHSCEEHEVQKDGIHSHVWICPTCVAIPGSDQSIRHNNIRDSLTPSAIMLKELQESKK